ncbi:hypothetical protein [Enterocloster clostridioformis]|uniref:hypothetical protein n=1 Tax=Enterocloster clostridioformis TaxID=1531 RepID=UPI0003F6FCAD|nr:hypothetical protein [Enterocloster clostridioformis]
METVAAACRLRIVCRSAGGYYSKERKLKHKGETDKTNERQRNKMRFLQAALVIICSASAGLLIQELFVKLL